MSVQMCEGIWRNRTGQRVVITRREPVGGQQWTDGFECYSDNGRYYQSGREDGQDLVSFVGLLQDSSQPDQAAKIELFRTTLTEQTAEIDRLRAENESLTVRLQRAEVAAAEALQRWETTEQVCLRIITALAEARS